MKKIIHNWFGIRGIKLLMGVLLAIQAVQQKELVYGLLALFLLLTAITNTGCCAGGSCATNIPRNRTETIQHEKLDTQE